MALAAIQNIVGIQIGMPQADGMKTRNQCPECAPVDRCGGARVIQTLGQGTCMRDLTCRQVGAVSKSAAHESCGDNRWYRQPRDKQPLRGAELAERPRRLGTGPDKPVAAQPRNQAAAPVMTNDAASARGLDNSDGTTSASFMAFTRCIEQGCGRRLIDLRIVDQAAAGIEMDRRSNSRWDRRGIIHHRSVTKPHT